MQLNDRQFLARACIGHLAVMALALALVTWWA